MEFKINKCRNEQINLIPMVSVIFLLLIFFLAAGTVRSPAFWDIKPPLSNSKEKVENKNLQIFLNQDGKVAFEKQTIAMQKLLQQLKEKSAGDISIQLHADKNVDSRKIIDLINYLDKSFVNRLVLITSDRAYQ